MKKKDGFIFFLLLLLVGCASADPKGEVKSNLGYLNGETYNAPQGIVPGAGIPVGYWGKINNRTTTIQGTVFHKQESMLFPLGHQKILLKNKQGKILKQVQSEANGEFSIVVMIPNGEYSLEISDLKFQGQIKLNVDSYQVHDLKIQALEK